ncbi:MAG: hypothetical protein IKO07_14210 [Clostridia bacterium]|nr:hypothetical protein [Clostridia bacterium]
MAFWNDDPNVMLVAGHRGACHIRPENTMNAFQFALDVGVDMIETDVRQTKDGQLVLMHDAKVDRTTDGSGLVRDHTFAEFRRLNAAAHLEGFAPEPPATLEELLEMTAALPTMLLNLELKEYPHVEGEEAAYDTADRTVEMVEKYGLGDRIILNSFSGKLLHYLAVKYDHRYPLHGFFPYFYLGPDHGDPDSYLDVACMFHAELKDGKIRGLEGQVCPQAWFDDVISRGIEPWAGAGVSSYDDLALAFERGARLVTANNPEETLEFLRRMGHHK